MKVLLINGSPRAKGETYTALAIIEKTLHESGVDSEWFQLGTESVRGCIHCNSCKNEYRCVFDDACNELIEKIIEADGVIIGTPVYFAGPNGALCALLDRVFYAGSCYGRLFKGKPSAAVTTCWRSGASATLDRLNKYFTYSEMPIVSSNYWNIKLEGADPYGEDILRILAKNMAELLGKCPIKKDRLLVGEKNEQVIGNWRMEII